MTEKELEYLLLENLKYAKENNHYLIIIEKRQRWRRNWSVFYWAVIILLAVGGYYYAFPYFKDVTDRFKGINEQIGGIMMMTLPEVN